MSHQLLLLIIYASEDTASTPTSLYYLSRSFFACRPQLFRSLHAMAGNFLSFQTLISPPSRTQPPVWEPMIEEDEGVKKRLTVGFRVVPYSSEY